MTTETRVTVAQDRIERAERIRQDLDERDAQLADVLASSHIDLKRFKRVVFQAVSKNPDILECTRESILRSIIEAAGYGLEPTGPYGGAHLVPFKGEATLIIDYRGLVAMALRDGQVADVESRLVFEGDLFEMELGSQPFVRHVPAFARDDPKRGNYRGLYTIVRYRDPAIPPHIDYMTMAEVNVVRDRTRNKGLKGPWADWYDEMAKKTGLRQALKVRAMTGAMAEVLEREDAIEGAPAAPAAQVSERRERLVAGFAPERPGATETPAEVEEAEAEQEAVESGAEALVQAFDGWAATCPSLSPIDGERCSEEDPDHRGVHRQIVDDEVVQTWPR